MSESAIVYRVFEAPRDRFRFMAFRNTGVGLVLATVLGAIQLSRMADRTIPEIVFHSPITAGLFIPTLVFGVWLAWGATEEQRAWAATRITIRGANLAYQRPGARAALQESKNLVYQLASVEGFALKPNGPRCSLVLTQSGVMTVIPLERVGREGEGVYEGEGWLNHPLVQNIEAVVGAPPQMIVPE